MPMKSVKMKISKNFLMSQGSLNQKIRFLGQTMCSVAREQTDTHRDTRKWLLWAPFQGFRNVSFNLSSRIGPIIVPASPGSPSAPDACGVQWQMTTFDGCLHHWSRSSQGTKTHLNLHHGTTHGDNKGGQHIGQHRARRLNTRATRRATLGNTQGYTKGNTRQEILGDSPPQPAINTATRDKEL